MCVLKTNKVTKRSYRYPRGVGRPTNLHLVRFLAYNFRFTKIHQSNQATRWLKKLLTPPVVRTSRIWSTDFGNFPNHSCLVHLLRPTFQNPSPHYLFNPNHYPFHNTPPQDSLPYMRVGTNRSLSYSVEPNSFTPFVWKSIFYESFCKREWMRWLKRK